MRNDLTAINNNTTTTNYRASIRNGKLMNNTISIPEILFITSYPPRECGLATYSQDLVKALNNKFEHTFDISICALESEEVSLVYEDEVKYILNINCHMAYLGLARLINNDENIKIVMIQHEFGLFKNKEADFIAFLKALTKPIVICFHTVLPNPNEALKAHVKNIAKYAQSIIVMTNTSALLLKRDYAIRANKIEVIAHGTHLISHGDEILLKQKYNFSNRKILSTFGLLGAGKSIETTLDALPAIIKKHKDVLFLILGKTHPSIYKNEGEKYRTYLQEKVIELKLQKHVQFVNSYLALPILLEYLQMTDVYLFTSKDPHQAVSGTFSYALSCGCTIVSTPIPHALEVLKNNTGVIVDFENPTQVSTAVITLLNDDLLRNQISLNGLHVISATAWENAAIEHAILFEKYSGSNIKLNYKIPPINLKHLNKLTTNFGIIQFAKINQPDIKSGYTLDDNARAMVATCQYLELYKNNDYIEKVATYLNFIKYCFQEDGNFLNYVNEDKLFTMQNEQTNLEDSNGRAVWALGYLISLEDYFPDYIIEDAIRLFDNATLKLSKLHSTRAMAFAIKGIYYANLTYPNTNNISLIKLLADRLVQMFCHESEPEWQWFESYLTYGNSILPEAMLCAYTAMGESVYKQVAKSSFDFLLSKTFTEKSIKVISNKGWLQKDNVSTEIVIGGEQPIDVAYTIMALYKFQICFNDEEYNIKMDTAFSWFLGNNHLKQVIYNPCTGGCYDGLEDAYVNLNQGAESTVSYLMARLIMEKKNRRKLKITNEVKAYQQKNNMVLN
jgi:glycosyltransferase involved in cell wall biosynthesis